MVLHRGCMRPFIEQLGEEALARNSLHSKLSPAGKKCDQLPDVPARYGRASISPGGFPGHPISSRWMLPVGDISEHGRSQTAASSYQLVYSGGGPWAVSTAGPAPSHHSMSFAVDCDVTLGVFVEKLFKQGPISAQFLRHHHTSLRDLPIADQRSQD